MQELTAEQFSALITPLRPALLQMARGRYDANDADAEDLVAETILVALHILPKFVPDTSTDHGLLRWIGGVMRNAASTLRKRAARQVPTAPLEAALNVPAPPAPESDHRTVERFLDESLPADRAALVHDWLAGYSQAQIAHMHRLHRNTVGNRLELAFQSLRLRMPNVDELSYDTWLLNLMSRHYVYRAPGGQSRRWFAKSPPDIRYCLAPDPDPYPSDRPDPANLSSPAGQSNKPGSFNPYSRIPSRRSR